MKVNWPERIWVNSPVRRYVQQRESLFFKKMNLLPPGGRCLEIGCGCGVGARLIHETFAPRFICALDVDLDMLKEAQRRRKAWPDVPLRLLVGDAQTLPFADASFDAVFNFGIIHHLEDWQSGVAEIARVLKDGGIFFFEEIYPPLFANPLFRIILDHPRENRFHGPEFRGELAKVGLAMREGYKESRFAVLGAAIREARKVEIREPAASEAPS